MNNKNDTKRIRDPTENEDRTVTVIHKASEISLNNLQSIISDEGYKEENVKLLEIDSSLVSNLKLDGTLKDAEKLREINGLESELLILYADEDLDIETSEITTLSEALDELHDDHTNILTIGHLFLGGETNGLPNLMGKDVNKVGTVKTRAGESIYDAHSEEELKSNYAGWLENDEQKISFTKMNGDEAVTYGDEFTANPYNQGFDISSKPYPLYSSPSSKDGLNSNIIELVKTDTIPIVISNGAPNGSKPTQVHVNMDLDQPEELHYIIGKAISFAGSKEACNDPKAIQYDPAATIYEDPCVQLRSEITSEKAILTNEDSLIDMKLSFNNDKINKNDIELQGETQIRLEINGTEHDFSAHDDTNHEDHGSKTKGKLIDTDSNSPNFEYELADGEIEIILEYGEHDINIETHNAPITDTNDERYTDDSNDEDYEKYNNGWEEFKYNLIIHDLNSIESDSNHADYHEGTHDKYYVNVPLKLTDSLEALTTDLKILGQIRKINKDGSHDLDHSVSLNNALDLYGAKTINLDYKIKENGDAGNNQFNTLTSFDIVNSDKLKAITMEGDDLTFTYEVNFEESNIPDGETGDELVIELKVKDSNGAEINLDSGEDHKEFELRLAIADCTDEDAINYNSNTDKEQLIADGELADTQCTYIGCNNSNADNYTPNHFINADGVAIDKSEEIHSITINDDLCHIEVCEDTNASNYDADAAGEFIRKDTPGLCEYRTGIEFYVERNNSLTNIEDEDGNIVKNYKNLYLEQYQGLPLYQYYSNIDKNGVVVVVKIAEVSKYDEVTLIDVTGTIIATLKEADDTDKLSIDYSSNIGLPEGGSSLILVIENKDPNYDITTEFVTIHTYNRYLMCPQDTDFPSDAYDVFAYDEDAYVIGITENVNNALTDSRVSETHYPEFYDILKEHEELEIGPLCMVDGCDDSNYEDYNASVTRHDQALCLTELKYGCTVEEAENFDEEAHKDDGSCEVKGCVDDNSSSACNYIDQNDAKFDDIDIKWEHDEDMCLYVYARTEQEEYILDIGDEDKKMNPEFNVKFYTQYLGVTQEDDVNSEINPLELGLTEEKLANTKWGLGETIDPLTGESSPKEIIQLKLVSNRFRSVSILGHIPGQEPIISWIFHKEPKYFQYSDVGGIKFAAPYNLEFTTSNPSIKYVTYLLTEHKVGFNSNSVNIDRMTKLDETNVGVNEQITFTRHYDEKEDEQGNPIVDENGNHIKLDAEGNELPDNYLDTDKCDTNLISILNNNGSLVSNNILYIEQNGEKLYTNEMVKLGGYYFNPDALEYGINNLKLKLRNLEDNDELGNYVAGSDFSVLKRYTACGDDEATNYDSTIPLNEVSVDNSLCEYDLCGVEGNGIWSSYGYDSECGDTKNCIPIEACKLEVCTDEGADKYVTFDESLHIVDNNLCEYTRCTDTNATNYNLLESEPIGLSMLNDYNQESATDSEKAIVEAAQIKLFNAADNEYFSGAVIITSEDGTSVTKLTSDTNLIFNDVSVNGFPEGAPLQSDFTKADGTDDTEAFNIALEEYNEKKANQEQATEANGFAVITNNNIHIKLEEYGVWKVQYILSSNNSRLNNIAPDQDLEIFDSSNVDHHARGVLEFTVEVGPDGYILNGAHTLISDNENLCTGVDPCDGEDKLYKDYIKLDACEVCILDEELHVLAIDENGICEDSNGKLYDSCPEGKEEDDCGDCRDAPVDGVNPEDWNESCNDCDGNPNGNYVVNACGACEPPDTLKIDDETNYCDDSNLESFGQCPEGHTDDCGTCHQKAPTKNAETGEITLYPADWNAECGICNDPAADNYEELEDGKVALNNDMCEFTICNDITAMNNGKTNSVKNGSFADDYGNRSVTNDSVCVYFGCANPHADNYDNGTYHPLNDGALEDCEYEYCDDEDACNYISLEDKQIQVGTEEGLFTGDSNCVKPTDFGISTSSYIKENNVDYEVSLGSESNVIGHQKVDIDITGNLLQSLRGNTLSVLVNGISKNQPLLVYPSSENTFGEKLNGLYPEGSSVNFEINFNEFISDSNNANFEKDNTLLIPIHIDTNNDPVSYKSPALVAAEEEVAKAQAAFDEAEAALQEAEDAKAAKQTEINEAEAALGSDSDKLAAGTLWGDYNAAEYTVTENGDSATKQQEDARDAALAAKDEAVAALGSTSDTANAEGSLYAQLAVLTVTKDNADTALTTAETALGPVEATVTAEEAAIRNSIANGRVPIPVKMTWHKDQEDELLVGDKFINTYNLEIELESVVDKEYFGFTHVLISIQDNNYVSHLGEIRNGDELVARSNMNGFTPQTSNNARLADSMSFGECSIDAIKVEMVSGSLKKEVVLLKNAAIELDLENDDVFKNLQPKDEIVITATALKWENYLAKEVITTEKTVTLHKLGCTDSNYNSYHESNTMPFEYQVDSETVQSCRNLGCLDEFADTYDSNADHADLSLCEYSITNNNNDPEKCDYDSNLPLLHVSDSNDANYNSVSEYAKYKFYCEDERSDLCQLWLDSGMEMLPPQLKEYEVTFYKNEDGNDTVAVEEEDGIYLNVFVNVSYEYLAEVEEKEYVLEETEDLIALAEKYIESIHATNKLNKLKNIINNSVDANNNIAGPFDHMATVGRALASMQEAAEDEDDAAKIEYDDLKEEFLAKYTDADLETYDTNISETKLDSYLSDKFDIQIKERLLELSCSGFPYLLLTAKTTTNTGDGPIDLNEIENMPKGEIEINLENAELVQNNVLTFKVGPLPNTTSAAYNSIILTPTEYEQLKQGSDNSYKGEGFEFGIETCDDTNADNYSEEALNAVDENGDSTARPTKSACEYYYCEDKVATNYVDPENVNDDGPEGKHVANDDACAYYYCDDELACNYYDDDLTLLYNINGVALTTTQAQQEIAVATKSDSICFIPTIEMTPKFEISKFYKEENTANVLRGRPEDVSAAYGEVTGHFNSNLLSTQLDESVFEEEKFNITYDGHSEEFSMHLNELQNQGNSTIEVPVPSLLGGTQTQTIYASWNFSKKAKQLDIGSIKFGYNIDISQNVPFNINPIRLFLRITNTRDHLFKGILFIPNHNPIHLQGTFASEELSQERKRINKIFNHQACDEVNCLALISNGVTIDKIYGDSEVFILPPQIRNTDEPVPFRIIGLNSNDQEIHSSDPFEILFLRTECGDSNAINYYDGINNDPDNSICEELACLDSNNCNYPEKLPDSGGEWVHDESLCWVENNAGDCCPELNECGACYELQTNADTGMCEHGDRDQECPEGMIEDRCGKCFASETDEGFDECVGCTTEDDYYYDSNIIPEYHDESMCAVCNDVEACNYDSNAKDDLSNVWNELCEYNTIKNIEVLPSLDDHMESKGYTKYDDFEVVFDSNIFENPFTSEHVVGKWTIGDMELELSEGERKFTVSGVEYHDGDLVDKDLNKVGTWKLHSTEQTLTAKQVSGAEWTRLGLNVEEKAYNLEIQTSDKTIYYINMEPFYSNPISSHNVIEDGQLGQLEHKFMRKDAKAEDNGDSCETSAVEYQLLRKATQKEIDDNELEEEWIEASTDPTSGFIFENRLQIASTAPGLHMLRLKPSCATCDGNKWEEHEFTLMGEICAIEEADNYEEDLFKTLGVSEEYAVSSMQNKLVPNGNKDAQGNDYMVPESTGACEYTGCNDENYELACNYSEYFETSGPCFLPDYGKNCDGDCVLDPVTGEPNKDECGECHPLDITSSDPRWNETCADCEGVPNGPHIIDLCETCVHKDSDEVNAECTDCAGIVQGQEGYGHYLVYTDAKEGDARFICTKTEKVCGDSNACNYDDAEDVNQLAIDDDVCTYPQGYPDRVTADCDNNCLEGYTADCRGLCGLETDETFLVKDSCGWCGGSSQNCSPLHLVKEERWQVATSCDKNSSIYDPHGLILSLYKINNTSIDRYKLLWNKEMSDSISDIELEPKTMLWIEIDLEEEHDEVQAKLDEIYFINLTAIQQLAKDSRIRLGHLGVRETVMTHLLNKETNVLDGSSIRGYTDELNVELVADKSKQTVLAEIQVNKRETNENGLVIENGEINHFWMKIDGSCVLRIYHADMNNAGTVVKLVRPNGLTPIESMDEGAEIIVGDIESEQEIWVKVQIQNRIDDGSNFTDLSDLITDTNHPDFDEEKFNAEMIATKTSYETVIVAIERLGTKFTGGNTSVDIKYSLDGPEGIDA